MNILKLSLANLRLACTKMAQQIQMLKQKIKIPEGSLIECTDDMFYVANENEHDINEHEPSTSKSCTSEPQISLLGKRSADLDLNSIMNEIRKQMKLEVEHEMNQVKNELNLMKELFEKEKSQRTNAEELLKDALKENEILTSRKQLATKAARKRASSPPGGEQTEEVEQVEEKNEKTGKGKKKQATRKSARSKKN